MVNTELFIDGQLVDTDNDLGVRLNRQIMNPADLNTKDAQFSYSIKLPASQTNNRVFKLANIEETRGKFNKIFNAELIVNSFRVFTGSFMLTSIAGGYKGNLFIAEKRTIKDIFGDSKLSENAPLNLPFGDFATSVSQYNEAARNGAQACIFPFILYGLLPKVPTITGAYSARELWDATVRTGMSDVPPAINPLIVLRHIFRSRGLSLNGSAFDDERLARLYVSYSNPSEYVQPWNYGQHATIRLRGFWSNVRNNYSKFERNGYQVSKDGLTYYASDIFDSTNADVTILEDSGGNVLQTSSRDDKNNVWGHTQVMIPSSGLYKIRLKVDLALDKRENWRSGYEGMQFVGGDASNDSNANSFRKKRYEIKLLSDRGTGDFGLSQSEIDRTYYRDNLPQNDTFDENNMPKFFPNPTTVSGRYMETMVIDPAQNPKLVAGFAWGNKHDRNDTNPRVSPRDGTDFGTVLAGKTGLSWNVDANSDKAARIAINSQGYLKWGRIGDFSNDLDTPPLEIPAAKIKSGVRFDADGLLVTGQPATDKIASRIELEAGKNYVLSIPRSSEWDGSLRLYNSGDETAKQVAEIEIDEGASAFEFVFDTNAGRFISLEIASAEFNVAESIRVRKLDDEGDVIGWESSGRYKIDVKNAPASYASRGWFKGNYIDHNWYADGVLNAVVWLEAGEILTLVSTSDEGRYKRHNSSGKYGWTKHEFDFELDIVPYRVDSEWITISATGTGESPMNWNDAPNFEKDSIDLVKFLPSEIKTDDFINNFCKAFNLALTQDGANSFKLDVKQRATAIPSVVLDLDDVGVFSSNDPLGLPSAYKLGFTVRDDEQGFVESGDDGGGYFETGAVSSNVVEQKSNFSFNWFKTIRKTQGATTIPLRLPIISESGVWDSRESYPESMRKRFYKLPQRFFYFDGLLNDEGASFEFNNKTLKLARVSNSYGDIITLNYKNVRGSLLNSFFTVIVSAEGHFTNIECYLSPEQYSKLDGSRYVRFNGDLYFVAQVDGFDPTGRNKTKIKLIRKI